MKMSDSQFYKLVWSVKPPECEECGCHLGFVPKAVNVSHILTKGAYPSFRHDLRNVNMLCFKHHNQWEFGDRKSMRIYKSNMKIIDELKLEYYENKS